MNYILKFSTVWVLRNCGIAQNLSFAKAEKSNFARNDFCEWLHKLLFFRAKLMHKERKILRFVRQKLRKSFANGNPTQIVFTKDRFQNQSLFVFLNFKKRSFNDCFKKRLTTLLTVCAVNNLTNCSQKIFPSHNFWTANARIKWRLLTDGYL